MQSKILFLDLERTIIDDVFSQNFLLSNLQKVIDFTIENQIQSVFIWSFALADADDVDQIKTLLEQLNERISSVIVVATINDMIERLKKKLKLTTLSVEDFFDTQDKFTSLFHFLTVDDLFQGSFFLIDDTVINMKVETDNFTLKVINIESL